MKTIKVSILFIIMFFFLISSYSNPIIDVSKEIEAMKNSNYTIAIPGFKTASDKGDPEAKFYLGAMYLRGSGPLNVNKPEAYRLIKDSANLEHSGAQYVLGMLYRDGDEGFSKNEKQALIWFTRAANNGLVESQYELGNIYEYAKLGTKLDYQEAVKWYLLSAKQNYSASQGKLSYLYSAGIGVVQNYIEAAKWAILGAEQGDPTSQYNLAVFYQSGNGIQKSLIQAHKWFNICSANPSAGTLVLQASTERDHLAMFSMTKEQVAEAQKLAFNWKQLEKNK